MKPFVPVALVWAGQAVGEGALAQPADSQMATGHSFLFLFASQSSCRILPLAIFSSRLYVLLRISFCQSTLKEKPCSKNLFFT